MAEELKVNTEESLYKDMIDVSYNGHTYTFRIPSVTDTSKIKSRAAKLRRESNPEGNVTTWDYTFVDLNYFENLATFLVLFDHSDASWVLTPSTDGGEPTLNPDKWKSGKRAPFEEVIEKFKEELLKF